MTALLLALVHYIAHALTSSTFYVGVGVGAVVGISGLKVLERRVTALIARV